MITWTTQPHPIDWLNDKGSMTLRMRAACTDLRIDVLRQASAPLFPMEISALGLAAGAEATVREVVMRCDGVPWLVARTAIPPATAVVYGEALSGLGTQPLGSLLFSDPSITRSDFNFAELTDPDDPLHQLACRADYPEHHLDERAPLVTRRSIFTKDGQPLLLTEVILPVMIASLEAAYHATPAASPSP